MEGNFHVKFQVLISFFFFLFDNFAHWEEAARVLHNLAICFWFSRILPTAVVVYAL